MAISLFITCTGLSFVFPIRFVDKETINFERARPKVAVKLLPSQLGDGVPHWMAENVIILGLCRWFILTAFSQHIDDVLDAAERASTSEPPGESKPGGQNGHVQNTPSLTIFDDYQLH